MIEEHEEFYCHNCRNTGMEFPDCEECEGNGWVDDPSDGGTKMCPDCNGEVCSDCNGATAITNPHALIPITPPNVV